MMRSGPLAPGHPGGQLTRESRPGYGSDAAPRTVKPGPRQRLAALAALALLLATFVFALDLVIGNIAWGLALLAALILSFSAAWYGLLGAGPARYFGFGSAALVLAGILTALLVYGDSFGQGLLVALLLALAVAAARAAIRFKVPLPGAVAPGKAVLFYNPKSGGGKAERFDIAREAKERGIEPVELGRDDDLEGLVRDAVARGADGLAMAGGDGSQAIVAAVAAEEGLPYAWHSRRHQESFRPGPGR